MSSVVATRSARTSRGRRSRRRRGGPVVRAIGALGELLVTAGLLLGLFVVWQLFWTDFESSRGDRQAVEDFQDTIEEPTDEPEPGPRTGPPPVMEAPGVGETIGTLYVPRWGEGYARTIREGNPENELAVLNQGGAAHYPDTAMPGDIGNFALAGHRQTYGAAFHKVDQLENGDRMIVQTRDAWMVYEVSESYVVTPDQVEVVAPVPGDPDAEPSERLITLTTCHPLWSTRERWIIHGELVEWYGPSRDMPEALQEGP
ncbi:class E sortase [Georgenia alba]|uniref:Class E sortase n=1 Tax=Georgenia alba TaxID=2233858 RepID=A0ABW2Q572_9MICO